MSKFMAMVFVIYKHGDDFTPSFTPNQNQARMKGMKLRYYDIRDLVSISFPQKQ